MGGETAGASRGGGHATVVCAAEETTHEHQIGSFGVRLTRDETVADSVWTKVVFNEVSWDTLGGSIPATVATRSGAPGSSILLQACGS